MFNLFNNANKKEDHTKQSEWLSRLEETKSRFFTFLDKLEVRMRELIDAAVPELQSLRAEDEREFDNMLHGVKGQLNSVREKARQTYEEKVEAIYQEITYEAGVLNSFQSQLYDFRSDCANRFHELFERRWEACLEELEHTEFTDYEVIYQAILDEHERIKGQFHCVQCSHAIELQKLYFTAVYLTCSACQTRNTYIPSTLAKRLEEVGRGLAEQRTKPLLEKYEAAQSMERELYHQGHKLKLTLHGIRNEVDRARALAQVESFESRREAVKASIPVLYRQYQRAMFDEWKLLVPDLSEQTENFYQGLVRRGY